jgi:hypothetical protein
MKTLLYLFFAANIFADTITTTQIPKYLGGGTTSVVKDSQGKVIVKAKTTTTPPYLGGGKKTVINGKIVKTTKLPKPLGGQSKSK